MRRLHASPVLRHLLAPEIPMLLLQCWLLQLHQLWMLNCSIIGLRYWCFSALPSGSDLATMGRRVCISHGRICCDGWPIQRGAFEKLVADWIWEWQKHSFSRFMFLVDIYSSYKYYIGFPNCCCYSENYFVIRVLSGKWINRSIWLKEEECELQ